MRGRFERGDRVALEHTDDPDTRLRDRVRLITPAPEAGTGEPGKEPGR